MKDEWRMIKNDEGWMKNYEGWRIKDDDLKLLRGFASERTDGLTDICECRVAFATENVKTHNFVFQNQISIFFYDFVIKRRPTKSYIFWTELIWS